MAEKDELINNAIQYVNQKEGVDHTSEITHQETLQKVKNLWENSSEEQMRQMLEQIFAENLKLKMKSN